MTSATSTQARRIVPVVVTLLLAAAGLRYRQQLADWFAEPKSDSATTDEQPVPQATEHGDHAQAGMGAGAARAVAYYTCAMHPSVHKDKPGSCPICGMTLVPVYSDEAHSGAVRLDMEAREHVGVRTARLERRPLHLSIRAVGEVQYDETRLTDVSLRVSGWVQALLVNQTGQRVTRGQPLLRLYSPELLGAQSEYAVAVRTTAASGGGASSLMANAARQRLRLLGMSDSQIGELDRAPEPLGQITISAPASGFVIEKEVVEGAKVEAGMRVYRIAALDRVWVEARVYEADLPFVRVGQAALITAANLGDGHYEGKVSYIYPYLDEETRTGRIRVELPNRDLALKPGLYADVTLQADLGEQLAVPEEAVLYTGPRRVVFVDTGDGKLTPTNVELAAHAEGYYAVRSGLHEGDVVVVAGNFFVAAESRIRSTEPTGGGHEH